MATADSSGASTQGVRFGRKKSVSLDALEANREDLAELKRIVEDEIRRDEQKLAFVKDKLSRSREIEVQMVQTLSQFDERLLLLEGSIQPIHQETLKLTRTQENLKSVSDLLKEAIHYHGVSQRMQDVINGGIAKSSLDEYISALNSIQEARQHFQDKAPENPELRALEIIESSALRTLENEFEQVLKTQSIKSSKHDLLQLSKMDILDAKNMFPDDALGTLNKIVRIMSERQLTQDIFYVYSKVRASVVASIDRDGLDSSVSPLRREKKGKGLMQSIRRKSQSANLDVGVLSNPELVAKRSTGNLSKRGHKRNASVDKNNERAFGSEIESEVTDVYDKGTHPYYVYFSVSLIALMREQALVQKLVEPPITAELSRLVLNPAMDTILGRGEALVGTLSRRTMRGQSGLCLLDILQLLCNKRSEINAILASCTTDIATRFHQLVGSLAQLGYRSLVEFQDYTQSDDAKLLPTDGTVHELTSNTFKFLKALGDYNMVTGYLLGTSGVLPQHVDALEGFEASDETEDCLVRWFASVLKTLCENLSRKARTYESPALSAVFLANNYDHVLKHVLNSPHINAFRRIDPNIDTRYLTMISQQRQAYKDATWASIVPFIQGPFLGQGTALSKKERELVKDKYSGFNEAFENTLELQKKFSIPNQELKDQIHQENTDYVLPLFEAFDGAYRNSGFSVKNPQKYLRFSPAMVERMLGDFFQAH